MCTVLRRTMDACGCRAAMKRLRCARPTTPCFEMTIVTRVKNANGTRIFLTSVN